MSDGERGRDEERHHGNESHDSRKEREEREWRRSVTCSLDAIVRAMESMMVKPPLGVTITVSEQRSQVMELTPVEIFGNQKIVATAHPLNADGTPNTTVRLAWASADPAQVGVEVRGEIPVLNEDGTPKLDDAGLPVVIPDTHSAVYTTPLEVGASIITISAPRYSSSTQRLSYKAYSLGELNVSVGEPVSDE